MIELIIFTLFSLPILYHDIKYQRIPDIYSIPAIVLIILIKLYFNQPIANYLIAATLIFIVFIIPLIFQMDFGGGDARYGVLSALIVGFPDIAVWMVISAFIHLFILLIIKKTIFGFAPAMFIATLITPYFSKYLF